MNELTNVRIRTIKRANTDGRTETDGNVPEPRIGKYFKMLNLSISHRNLFGFLPKYNEKQ